jgi:DNA-binding CsgD family transcriptional regulator
MLTDRELEVLQRIGNGLTTQQIGQELRVSPKTVQTYRERIKRKLALDSAAELSSEATRWVLERAELATAGSSAAP